MITIAEDPIMWITQNLFPDVCGCARKYVKAGLSIQIYQGHPKVLQSPGYYLIVSWRTPRPSKFSSEYGTAFIYVDLEGFVVVSDNYEDCEPIIVDKNWGSAGKGVMIAELGRMFQKTC